MVDEMKLKRLQMDISYAMSVCLRSGLKVYPVVTGRNFKIEIDDNGNLTRYNKEVNSKELNKAMSETYKYFAAKLITEQDANSTRQKAKTMEAGKKTIPTRNRQ